MTTTKTDFGPSSFVTKDYVDNVTLTGDYLPLSGGTLTGTLTGQLKTLEQAIDTPLIKPGDSQTAFIRTDGTSKLSTLTIESPMASGAERAFEIKGRLADGTTISKDFFYMYANSDGTPSAMNYKARWTMSTTCDQRLCRWQNDRRSFYVSSGSLYFEMD